MSKYVNESFNISAERKYRRVYQGTVYTLTWTDATGEHKAQCRNFNRLMSFASNGYTTVGLRLYYPSALDVKVLA